MAAPILPVHLTLPVIPAVPPAAAAPSGGAAFQSLFSEALSSVQNLNQNAQTSINSFLSGEGEELHQVAIKTQQAELSFDLFMQVRNKLVSAYQEVMRMQV
ncbi:MAG TPA: flagellar hook-basal body complex protein FliE [Bryobacteraceae bacterium]|jgi:flagellar hook-basal body complex protein FliE